MRCAIIILKRLWVYFKEYKFLIGVALVSSILAAAMNGALAYSIKPLLDGIFIEKNTSMLMVMPLAIVAIYFFKGLFRFIQNFSMRSIGQRVVEQLRNELYGKLLRLPVPYYTEQPTGVIMSRVMNDVNMMQQAVPTIVTIIREVLSIFGLVYVVFAMNWKLALIAVAIYPLFVHPLMVLGKRVKKYSKKGQEQMADLTAVLQETISGIRVVKAFVMEKKESQRFASANENVVKYLIKQIATSEATVPLMEFVGSIGIAAIVYYGGMEVIEGRSTPGTFFSFIAAMSLIYEPVKRIGNSNNTVQNAVAAAERVFEVMDLEDETGMMDGTLPCDAHGKVIHFKDVHFRYHDAETDTLHNINLTVQPGETVAFVGSSGSGKTTMVNLIPRFFDVTQGAIIIGDTNLNEFSIASLRGNIGMVSQEPFLFNASIRENISYGDDRYSDEQIFAAATAAYAHDFVSSLPEGYDTVVGERGVRLSGGQKQRLTIARALLKNPPILILDEATSALDSESERVVQQALDNLMVGRTSFVIAHRLSTILNADRIVVLDKGVVVATGKHAELVESSPIYRTMYQMQFGEE